MQYFERIDLRNHYVDSLARALRLNWHMELDSEAPGPQPWFDASALELLTWWPEVLRPDRDTYVDMLAEAEASETDSEYASYCESQGDCKQGMV